MSEEMIRSRIKAALLTGKLPGVLDLPKVISLTRKLEACDSSGEVAVLLEQNRALILKVFKIPEMEISSCIRDIRAIS